ncbi:hypothetical protein OH787_05435 [Streptomyces sp. NBC_01547]|uniref:hypothetical protein n=1 Tax=Streptomyces sp. NBC_01547 TaxID=2975873 RepID=UPI0038697D71
MRKKDRPATTDLAAHGSASAVGLAPDAPFVPSHIRYVEGRIADATGITPTLERPHPGRLLLRHKVGGWELVLSWSRKPGTGWRKSWRPMLSHEGRAHPPFSSLTAYAAAVRGLPCRPPAVVPAGEDEDIPPLVQAQLNRETTAGEADGWTTCAGRFRDRWVVACTNGGELVFHWYFIERDGRWVHDDLDRLLVWDDLGECSREFIALCREQNATPAGLQTLFSLWRAVRFCPDSLSGSGSSVGVRLRL